MPAFSVIGPREASKMEAGNPTGKGGAGGNGEKGSPGPAIGPARISRAEGTVVAALFALTAGLQVLYVFHHRFNSDEPQHLHVVWGWTRGLVQYRDVFDNHTPLFHLAFAPLLAMWGERPDILFIMRLAMIPLVILSLWATYRIGREVFDRRTGWWAALFTGLYPTFLVHSIEFRTDILWTALWLLALAVLFESRPGRLRPFIGGVLLGAAFGVSLKTVLLLASLSGACLAAFALDPGNPRRFGGRGFVSFLGAVFIGMLVVPAGLVLFFVLKGAGPALLYGAVLHNLAPGVARHSGSFRIVLFVASVPLWLGVSRILLRRGSGRPTTVRIATLLLTAGFYFTAVHTLWPVFTPQDHLPFYPLAIILLTPLVLGLTDRASAIPGRPAMAALAPGAWVAAEIIILLISNPVWRNGTRAEVGLLTDVLRLTRPGDFVLDLKGETVFRRRPFYFALETVTRARIRAGLISDDIPERLIATRTAVAAGGVRHYPPRARDFLEKNYLSVGRLRVAGRFLDEPADGSVTIPFDVEIPARYVLIGGSAGVTGKLDGEVYEGSRFLERGTHEFRPFSGAGRIALVWAPAVERGFVPLASNKEAP